MSHTTQKKRRGKGVKDVPGVSPLSDAGTGDVQGLELSTTTVRPRFPVALALKTMLISEALVGTVPFSKKIS